MAKKRATKKTTTSRTESQVSPAPAPSPFPFAGPNTIVLSTDMSTLYLIDNGRAIPFSLDTIGGVLIGEIRGQLTVVSAMEPFPKDDKPTNGNSLQSFATERSAATRIPVVKALKLPISQGNWQFLHIRERRQVCVIGAVDIDFALKGDKDLEAQGYLFDLRDVFVNIQKVGNTLIFESLPVNS